MKNSQNTEVQVEMNDAFTEKWFSEELSLVTGLYQLKYDGQWRCIFASDECAQVLKCSDGDFMENLQSLTAFTGYREQPVTVARILQQIAKTGKSRAFISIRPWEHGKFQYIKGTLSVAGHPDECLLVHGQITDVSGEQERDVRSQSAAEQGKRDQQIFNIVAQHSNRILYAYDLATGTTRPWDVVNQEKDILAHLYTGNYTDAELEKNEFVLPDSTEAVKGFFGSIHGGVPAGEVNVHIKLADGRLKWYHFKYSTIFEGKRPVTAVISIEDITERYEHERSILQRADFDTMTGLLRKEVGEERMKAALSDSDKAGGILIAMDLDDLKGINDTLGHQQGDVAITEVANALKKHFRQNDILVRMGGDEFAAFLPGAGQSVSSVELSVMRLLQKISGITIGEKGERTIHCSIGCAVELPGIDTYETLFGRADTALYHVKRSGKNNFAFYVPEMTESDYAFKAKSAMPIMDETMKLEGLQHLLDVITAYYPSIILFNLSKNYFQALSFHSDDKEFPLFGTIELLWDRWAPYIHPDDQGKLSTSLSRECLLDAYAAGKSRVTQYYRNIGSWGNLEMEITANFFRTEAGDICAYLFFRYAAATGKELELQRLQKILELTTAEDIEYVCLINMQTQQYSVFRSGSANSHGIPENADFNTVTKHIRDTQIPPEDKDAYYENAALENVIQRMAASEEGYDYRYTMTDGITRETSFAWYEESHFELLMIVRKV